MPCKEKSQEKLDRGWKNDSENTEQVTMSTVKRILLARWVCCLWVFLSTPSYAADTVKGGNLYKIYCESCHGVSGLSVIPDAPSFDQGEGLFQSDSALLNSIKDGKNGMPAYQGILSDREILNVVAYLRTLN